MAGSVLVIYLKVLTWLYLQEVEYSPEANDEYWDTRPLQVMSRTFQIGKYRCTCYSHKVFCNWFMSEDAL